VYLIRGRRSFTPMGMYLPTSGRFDSNNTDYWPITGTAADPAYPGTVMSGDGILLKAGVAVTLTGLITFSGNSSAMTGAIYLGATQAAVAVVNSSAQAVLSHTVTPAADVSASLALRTGSASVGNRTVMQGVNVTYLRVTAA
jgi:hypothetical protein